MKWVKAAVFLLLNVLQLLVLALALMVFTSLIKGVPWYEPCGLQVLAIWTRIAPALVVLGLLLLLIGLILPISKLSRALPFLGAAALSLAITCHWKLLVILGVSATSALILSVIFVTIRDLIRSTRTTSPNQRFQPIGDPGSPQAEA